MTEGEDGGTRELEISYREHGFGGSVAGAYEVVNNLEVFADFTMLFTNGIEVKTDFLSLLHLGSADEYIDLFELMNQLYEDAEGVEITAQKLAYSVAAGVKYNLGFNIPVDIKVGGGVFYERFVNQETVKNNDSELKYYLNVTNFGVTALAEAEYEFAEGFGAVLTVMPRLGLYNSLKAGMGNGEHNMTFSGSGYDIGFSMPVCVGVVYHF